MPYKREANRSNYAALDGGVPFGKLLTVMLKSMKLDDQLSMGRIEGEWPKIMGTAVAAHTRPGRLIGSELAVYVDSSVWLSELHRSRARMLANLQKAYGPKRIQSMRLQIDPGKSA